MTGTKQKIVQLGSIYRALSAPETIIGSLTASGACPQESCVAFANTPIKLIIGDMVDGNFGQKIISSFTLPADGRLKLVVQDSEGRQLTLLASGPNTSDTQLFDQRDNGYLCFEPKAAGIAIVKRLDGSEALNCFSAVRKGNIGPTTIGTGTGAITFIGLNNQPANSSIWAGNDDRYFSSLINDIP